MKGADSTVADGDVVPLDARYRELGRAGRGALAALLYEAVMRLRGVILLPLLTKFLDSAVYGLYVQAWVVVGVGGVISGLQLHHGLVRFLPGARDEGERRAIFLSSLLLTLVVGLVLVPVVCLGAVGINRGLGGVVLPLGVLVLLRNFVLLFAGYFRARERILSYSTFQSAVSLGEVAVVGMSAVLGLSLEQILWRLVVVNGLAVGCVVGWLLWRDGWVSWGALRQAVGRSRLLRPVLPLASFSAPMVIWGVAWWVVESSDRMVIGRFLGDRWAGYYHPAYVLGALLLVVPRLAGTVLPPMAARLHDRGSHDQLRFLLASYWKALLVVGIPFVMGCLVLQGPVLRTLATEEVARYSRGVTPLIAVSTLFLAGAAIFGEVLKLKMRPGYAARVWAVSAVVSLSANILLVPRLGIIAGAVSAVVAFGLAFAWICWAAQRHIPVPMQPNAALCCGVACLPMLGAFAVLRPEGLFGALGLAGAGLVAYGGLIWAMGVVRRPQLALVWSALVRRRYACRTGP